MGCPSIPIKAAVFLSLLPLVWCYHGNLHNAGKPGVHQRLCTIEPGHLQASEILFPKIVRQHTLTICYVACRLYGYVRKTSS